MRRRTAIQWLHEIKYDGHSQSDCDMPVHGVLSWFTKGDLLQHA
jgi:hypothetical protein